MIGGVIWKQKKNLQENIHTSTVVRGSQGRLADRDVITRGVDRKPQQAISEEVPAPNQNNEVPARPKIRRVSWSTAWRGGGTKESITEVGSSP